MRAHGGRLQAAVQTPDHWRRNLAASAWEPGREPVPAAGPSGPTQTGCTEGRNLWGAAKARRFFLIVLLLLFFATTTTIIIINELL